jgi:hypothetical protein
VAADEQRVIAELPETGIFDPHTFRRFSTEGATVVRLYADQDLSVVTGTWRRVRRTPCTGMATTPTPC